MKIQNQISILTLFLIFSCQSKTDKLKSICENHILNNYVNDPSGFEVTSFSLTKVLKYDLNTYSNNYLDDLYEALKNRDDNFNFTKNNFKKKLLGKVFVKKMYQRLKTNESFELTFAEFCFFVDLNLSDRIKIMSKPVFDPNLGWTAQVDAIEIKTGNKFYQTPNGVLVAEDVLKASYGKSIEELLADKQIVAFNFENYLNKLVKIYSKNGKIDKLTIKNSLAIKYPEFKIEKTLNKKKVKTIIFYRYRIVTRQKLGGELRLSKDDFLFDENNKMLKIYKNE